MKFTETEKALQAKLVAALTLEELQLLSTLTKSYPHGQSLFLYDTILLLKMKAYDDRRICLLSLL